MEWLLLLSISVALVFDLVNGFHDAANSIATVVSTQVLRPGQAVLFAAFFNLMAMFLFAPAVADTLSKIVHITPHEEVYLYVVLSGLLGATLWNLITWWFGLPTSSSHALIGAVAGAGFTFGGLEVLDCHTLLITALFIVIAPLMGFVLGFIFMLLTSWLLRKAHPTKVDSWFRKGQLISAALYSIGHGANDAQKTMGIIVALLIAAGTLSPDIPLSISDSRTSWIILSCQLAMAIGTAFGGWKIVKTMGMRITKLKPHGGFCAETAGTCTLFFATVYGIPVSTTHTINGAIIGVGSCSTSFSSVRWGVASNILTAWILTIPSSAIIASVIFILIRP